jgi:uncharacterized protein
MNVPIEHIEPSYFRLHKKPLFGIYHIPQSGPTRDCGVVLCYPLGHEYIYSHRAYRQLAYRLSHLGFPVLRFDFYGCGDSDGDCAQGEMRQWLMDIAAAIDAIRRKSDVEQVCVVGLRLGGMLAAMAGAARGDFDGLVLWDTVINGQTYLEELRAFHQEWLRRFFSGTPQDHLSADRPAEIVGFPLTDSLRLALEPLDLLALSHKPATHILVIDSAATPGDQLREHLQRLGARVAYQHLASPQIWREHHYKAFVPHRILESVVSWMAEMFL